MKRPIYAAALIGVLLLTGCSGVTRGKDSLEPCGVAGYGTTVFPDITTDTQVREQLDKLLEKALSEDYQGAFDMLIVEDTTFVGAANFEAWFKSSGIQEEYTLREDNRNKIKYVNVSSGAASYDFYPEKQEDGTWKYRLDDLCIKDYEINIPVGIPATLDGIDISTYATGTSGNNTIYTIPQITNAPHTLVIDTAFTEPISIEITDCSKPVDITPYLVVDKVSRKTLIEDIAGPKLKALTKVIASQDWEKFCKYFTPDKNMQDYQSHFYKGRVKANTYELTLAETRDLEGTLDVVYTGYNTISVRFGTSWTWYSPDDVRFDADGNAVNLNERLRKTMRVVNTIELYKDFEADKWYVNNMDTSSITLLSPGEEQW